MHNSFFQALELNADQSSVPLDELIEHLAFNESGLIPVITQDAGSKQVLMFAWMNKDAIFQTLSTQRMTYWSRSRQQLWIKGESSGHTQQLIAMSFDCDGDAILCQVKQAGAACHTGRADCFYLQLDMDGKTVRIQGDAAH